MKKLFNILLATIFANLLIVSFTSCGDDDDDDDSEEIVAAQKILLGIYNGTLDNQIQQVDYQDCIENIVLKISETNSADSVKVEIPPIQVSIEAMNMNYDFNAFAFNVPVQLIGNNNVTGEVKDEFVVKGAFAISGGEMAQKDFKISDVSLQFKDGILNLNFTWQPGNMPMKIVSKFQGSKQ